MPTFSPASLLKGILPIKIPKPIGMSNIGSNSLATARYMKMENNINADKDGKITAINVSKGESVLEGTDLVIIE